MRKFVLISCLIYSVFSFSNQYGCVVFSELMVDPEPAVGLPDVEYIELYNRSKQSLSLNGWTLHYGEKAYSFPETGIDSGQYLLLCSKGAEAQFSPEISPTVFPNFPTLGNTGKQIYVLDEQGQLVTCLEYSPKWHANDFKAKGGWSLECIDVDNLSGRASNWTSSTNRKGGTPGSANSVAAVNPDEAVPVLSSIYILSPRQIELTFSKSLQPDVAASALNFEISPPITAVSSVSPVFPFYRSVILNLSDSLVSGTIYDLTFSNLTDVSGHSLEKKSAKLGLPETPGYSDLSLNEVLFNPVSNGCDYVEFVNVSDKCIDLSQVWLTNKSESGALNEGVRLSEKPLPCLPGSYWLLSVSADTVISVNGCPRAQNAIDLTSFPSMPDVSGNVALITTAAQIIDEMSYKESMHFALISLCEGVSLEKLNPELASSRQDSWRSASSESGYGTPGFINSQFRDLDETEGRGFSVPKKWITPNNDGQDDLFVISYQVSELSLANLIVYDLNGRVVKSLAKNELLATTGSFFWDGTVNNGNLVPSGRYILQTEYFTPSGERNKKRFVLTVLF